MKMVKTTITIKLSLLTCLKLFSQRHHRSISDIIEQGITQVIEKAEQANLDEIHKGLVKLQGMGKDIDPKYQDVRVDDILYDGQSTD